MTQLQPTTPPALERVVSKCLAKDPDDRWQNAGDLAIELNWAAESGLQAAMEVVNRKNSLVWMALSLVLMAALATLTVFHFRRSPAPATVVRFSFAPPEKTSRGTAMAFSPDGSTLAFVATNQDGKDQIWLRRLSVAVAERLSGTDGASFPFWSPDSRYVGFFADQKLKVVPASGGTARSLCDVLDGHGGAWGSKDVIVFSPHWQGGLDRISAAGERYVQRRRWWKARTLTACRPSCRMASTSCITRGGLIPQSPACI